MTGSEFVFLAFGLILGVAAGAALIEFIRARPPAREVRLTVAPDAVPRRRAATLANDAFTDSPVVVEPAHGGPADRGALSTVGASASDGRTPVLQPGPGTVAEPAFRLTGPSPASRDPLVPGALVAAQALPVSSGIDPMLTALRASAAASAEAAMQGITAPVATAIRAHPPAMAGDVGADVVGVGSVEPPSASAGPARGRSKTAAPAAAPAPSIEAPAVDSTARPAPSGPCGDARRLADERCELASRARAQAVEAEEAHRAVQRAYEDHERAMVEAATAADARGVREAKDQAQARFRAARATARSADDVEASAREWLHEINRINAETGDASAALSRARAAAPQMAVRLERAALEADGARVAAESAEAACVAARQGLADCEERAAGGAPKRAPVRDRDGGSDEGGRDDTAPDTLVAALRAGASPRIVRLLRGDRTAMHEVVDALAGEDPDERRRWQLAMADFVDAILADAITASALEFPTDHPFWGPFNRSQGRDITAALSSLGYRFDGLGGWVDDRAPSQRDLSLALGYAGLDPMRMRHWPSETEMAKLFEEVEVAAAEHLAGTAGGMTLGELVAMLGRRADALAEIWNAWGRIRPVLLDER
ncbi:MAG TPA: hypothetical protein VHK05_02385 [Candidatus Limnocylindrales bacterium]|nr:hypothetical protein [Candidatus Limnocylindrales bacterium]